MLVLLTRSTTCYGKKIEAWAGERVGPLVVGFLLQPVTPAAMLEFEQSLREMLRELGRELVEWTCNALEPEEAEDAAEHIRVGAAGYRRTSEKTPNRDVATAFGPITLWRRGYRSWDRDDGEPMRFPLEEQLGLVAKTTPLMAGLVARRMGEAGSTQRSTLDWLRRAHGLSLGAARLRKLCEQVSSSVEEQRESLQVQQLLKWLKQAQDTRGRRKPVLAVGRDGVSFHVQGVYEVGSTATISVYGRDGKRLGTVYLAHASEPYQVTLSAQLTSLLKATLGGWEGPPPRLCYVTDSGDAETRYFRQTLRKMEDPRRPGKRLEWIWVVDYFHAAERISIMAKALKFRSPRAAESWGRRMRKLLLKPGGAGRLLHSAAAMKSRLGVKKYLADEFKTAVAYLRKRTKFMRYDEFKRQGLPIGSGVTEAACKTVFTQRLKLSGMQWKRGGANVILRLRVTLLSGLWDQAYTAAVKMADPSHIRVHDKKQNNTMKNAA